MIPQLNWSLKIDRQSDQPDIDRRSAELEMRASFFRQQWETVGPGHLSSICQQLPLDTPRQISIQLTVPGKTPTATTIDEQNCRCDAMLHDVDPRLSETIRLTWAIAGCLVLQSRTDVSAAPSDNHDSVPASVSTGLVAASLTLRTGLEIGVLQGEPQELVRIADSLWGLQLDASGFEWLTEDLMSSPA